MGVKLALQYARALIELEAEKADCDFASVIQRLCDATPAMLLERMPHGTSKEIRDQIGQTLK